MCIYIALLACFSQTSTKCPVLLVNSEAEPLPSNITPCCKCRTSYKTCDLNQNYEAWQIKSVLIQLILRNKVGEEEENSNIARKMKSLSYQYAHRRWISRLHPTGKIDPPWFLSCVSPHMLEPGQPLTTALCQHLQRPLHGGGQGWSWLILPPDTHPCLQSLLQLWGSPLTHIIWTEEKGKIRERLFPSVSEN